MSITIEKAPDRRQPGKGQHHPYQPSFGNKELTMMHPDLNKLAETMREAHVTGTPMRLPALRVRDIAQLTRLMRQLETPMPVLAH